MKESCTSYTKINWDSFALDTNGFQQVNAVTLREEKATNAETHYY